MVTPALSYPGVYVQEVPSGVRTIVGVGTSIGMFIGAAKKGPINRPVRCVSYADYARAFGEDPAGGDLVRFVKLFFLNGGSDCYVMRIASGAVQSSITLQNEAGVATLRLTAKDAGVLGNDLRAVVTYSGAQPEVTFNLEIFRFELDSSGTRVKKDIETWSGLSMDPASPSYAQDFLTQNSKLVNATDLGVGTAQGGIEVSRHAVRRPAPTGVSTMVTLAQLNAFASANAIAVNSVTLQTLDATNTPVSVPIPLSVETVVGARVVVDAFLSSPNGDSDGVREKLALIAQAINNFTPPVLTQKFSWKAEVWGSRLGIQPGGIYDDNYISPAIVAAPAAFANLFNAPDVHYFRLGLGGAGTQTAPVVGNDGGKPAAADYDNAYDIIDQEVDLYNLMVLPPDASVPVQSLYPTASVRCKN